MQSGQNVGYSADPRDGQNTSDHTYQAAHFALENDKGEVVQELTGATWNLMNFCRSKKTNGGKYANNAWDMDETDDQYFDRKERQLIKILGLIDKEQYDFMFLQEIDILMPAHPSRRGDTEFVARLASTRQNFINALQARGLDIIISQPSKNNRIKPLATIYNKMKLKHVSTSNVLQAEDGEFKGFKNVFRTVDGQLISLTNLHLHYPENYSSSIPMLQSSQVEHDNQFNIMGGDTNHAPNNSIAGLINNWNNITNIDGIEKDGKRKLTGKHKDAEGKTVKKGDNSLKKCYDCFLTNPTQKTRVKIRAEVAEVFQKNADGEFQVVPLAASEHVHVSALGKPWVRGGYKAEQDALKAGKGKEDEPAAKSAPAVQSKVVNTQSPTQMLSKRFDFNRKSKTETAEAQAKRIFDLLMVEVKQGRKCALLYAANHGQAKKLFAYNNSNMQGAMPNVDGTGQAELFHELIKLINKNKDQVGDAICVLPIATSLKGGADVKGNQVSKEQIDSNISEVARFLDNGYVVYGMPRMRDANEYSIGGGQSKNWMSEQDVSLHGLTKNEYFQERMKQLEALSCHANPDYSYFRGGPKKKAANVGIFSGGANDNNVEQVIELKKPKSYKLLALLQEAKKVYNQIEGKKGEKGKKLRSGKHSKDIDAIIATCQNHYDAKHNDSDTVCHMLMAIHTLCLGPANDKYTKKGMLCTQHTLEQRLSDPKFAKHHHLSRLMLVVMDATAKAKLLPTNIIPLHYWCDKVQNHPGIIPQQYENLYQKVYDVVRMAPPLPRL